MAPSVTQRSARETVESLNWEESEAALKPKASKKIRVHAKKAICFRTFLLLNAACIQQIGMPPGPCIENVTPFDDSSSFVSFPLRQPPFLADRARKDGPTRNYVGAIKQARHCLVGIAESPVPIQAESLFRVAVLSWKGRASTRL